MAKDPICNMEVDEQTAEFKSQYASQTYYFCTAECHAQFELRPEHYACAA
jgi:Cu+-exporting ATPase